MTTPGFSLVNTAEAVEFTQHLALPTQRNIMLGDPAAFANDSDVANALTNIHGKAKQSAEIVGRFALTMYNMSHRLLGLPDEHAFSFKTKIVEHWAPEAMEHIDTSHKLAQLAKRYPAFTARVKSSFYSPIELAKVRTRVELPA